MKNLDLQIFPIPITFGTLGNQTRELNKQLVSDMWKEYNNKPKLQGRSGSAVISAGSNGMENRYDSFKQLATLLEEWVYPSIQKHGMSISSTKIVDMSAKIINDPVGFHMPHSHTCNYFWTGVYYPTTGIRNGEWLSQNEDLDNMPVIESTTVPKPGNIVFLDPIENIKTTLLADGAYNSKPDGSSYVNRYPLHGLPISMTPRESACALFPAYLSHMTAPTRENNFERYTIPFHVEIKYY